MADFEAADASKNSEDWAFGLADVLAAELQQRGVTLFERQQIRVVLGERKITASGLMQLRGNPAQEIPDLRYLVTGNIRVSGEQKFSLETSLVEARTGRNVASFSHEGRYPEELTGALTILAGQLAGQLQSTNAVIATDTTARPVPTRTPEVTLLFYKGVSYCLAGQPELGVTWFMDAQKVAPNFLPARLWTLRAFEMIGLPDFAAVARSRLSEAPNGQGLLNCLNVSPFLDRNVISVAVLAHPGLDSAGRNFQSALKTALAAHTNLFVADPSNIHSLAAEMDLQLAENGARDLELTSVLWSTVDALVLIKSDAATPESFSIELRDALSGNAVFQTQTRPDSRDVTTVSRALVEHLRDSRKTSSSDLSGGSSRQTRAAKPVQVSNTDRDEFAGLLKYLAATPSDRPAWMRLGLFVRWLNPLEAGRLDGRYECAIADRVVAATDPKAPDAAQWTAGALWHRRYYERPLPSIAVEAAPLLRDYPESPEAQYVRSAVAMELVDQQKYAEAGRIFLKLADELPRVAAELKLGPDFWANFYFFSAATFRELGDETRARQFLAQSAEVLRQNPGLGLSYSQSPFPQTHSLFGAGRDLRQAVAEWQARINPASSPRGNEMTLEQLDALLTEVRHLPEGKARPRIVEFLQRLIDHKQAHPELYEGRIAESDYKSPYRKVEIWGQGTTYGYFSLQGKCVMEGIGLLAQLAASRQSLDETRRLAAALADHLDASIAANCFEAVGEREQALRKVEEAIAHPAEFAPVSFGMHPTREQTASAGLRRQKIRLLQGLGRTAEAAEYARAQAQALRDDADAQLAATVDAVEACLAIGQSEEACSLLAGFVRSKEVAKAMTSQSAAARIRWAEQETARKNYLEASEILREVVRQSEGKDWGVYLRTGYAKTYDAAVSRLAQLRSLSMFPVNSTDWERPRRSTTVVQAAEEETPTELERDLAELLRGTRTGPNQRSYGGAPVGVFVKKYGHSAVPALLQAAGRDDFAAHLLATLHLLDVATPADAPAVLAAFKSSPPLAPIAFRLDPTNAAAILHERFAIYSKGGQIPLELMDVIEKFRLQEECPVLIANLNARELNGALAPFVTTLDRIFQNVDEAQVKRSYKAALAALIQRQMLSNYRYGLATLGEIALRNGVVEGVEALARGGDPSATNSLSRLRTYIDLPAGDAQARKFIESNFGRWRWDAQAGKFTLGAAGSQ